MEILPKYSGELTATTSFVEIKPTQWLPTIHTYIFMIQSTAPNTVSAWTPVLVTALLVTVSLFPASPMSMPLRPLLHGMCNTAVQDLLFLVSLALLDSSTAMTLIQSLVAYAFPILVYSQLPFLASIVLCLRLYSKGIYLTSSRI